MIKVYHGTHLDNIHTIAKSGALKSPHHVQIDRILQLITSNNTTEKECLSKIGAKSIEELALNASASLFSKRELEHRVKRYSLTTDMEQAENYARDNGIILGFGISVKKFKKQYMESAEGLLKDYEILIVKKILHNATEIDIMKNFRTVYFKESMPLKNLCEIHVMPGATRYLPQIKEIFKEYTSEYKIISR